MNLETILARKDLPEDIQKEIKKLIFEHEKAINTLKESESRYENFISHSSEGIYRIEIIPPVPIDLPQNKIVDWITEHAIVAEVNEALAQMYGLSCKEMIGHYAKEFAPEYGKRAALVLENKLLQVHQEETLDIDNSGRSLWLIESYHGEINNGYLERIWGVQRNIADKKISEKALQESEQKFRQITENIREVFWIGSLDWKTIYYISPAYKHIWGREPEELYNSPLSWMDSILEEDREKVMAAIPAQISQDNRKFIFPDYRIKNTDDSIVWISARAFALFDQYGKPDRIVGIAEDITNRKTTELELDRERKRANLYLNTIDTIIISLDCDGNIEMINKKGCEVLGYEENELIGKNWFKECLPQPDGMHNVYPFFKKIVCGELDNLEYFENYIITRSGNKRLIAWHNNFLTDEHNNIIGALSSGNDITERTKMEDSLRESEDRLNIATSILFDYIFQLNIDESGNLSVYWVSDNFFNITGSKPESFNTNQSILDVFHPEDQPKISRFINKIIRDKALLSIECRTHTQSRKSRWVTVSCKPVYDENKGRIISLVGGVQDITERKLAEEALKEREARLNTITENSPDTILQVDKNCLIVFVNRLMPGLKPEEVIGSSIYKWVPEEQRPILNDVFNNVFNNGKRGEYESAGPGPYGDKRLYNVRVMPVIVDNETVSAIYTATDITIRKESEIALKDSEERYRKLVELSPDGIFIHVGGVFVFSNYAGAQILGGKTPEDIIGKRAVDFVHPDFKGLVKERISTLTKEQHRVPLIEEKLIRLDGEVIDAEVAGIPFRFNDKPAVQLMIRDITKRKKAEEEHLRLQNLESLGILAGGIAHDFNNILSAILGRASVALEDIPEGSIRSDLTAIEKASKRAVGLTQQLLTFAKGGIPEKCIIDHRKLIRDTTNFSLSGSNVVVNFNFNDSYKIEADAGQIGQVIQNLVINAKQAMPSGGKITISTENYDENNLLKYLKISIEDQGIGIPEDHLTKIFDPYYTTKQTGSGLGLSVCHSIIIKHEGKISVESEIGKGSVFVIYLPASFKEIPTYENPNITASKKLNILIMDDEEDIRDLYQSILQRLGHAVAVSSTGEESIRIYEDYKENKKKFDGVFMDLTVKGGMGGKEAVKKLKIYDPEAKVIVASGYSDSSTGNYKEDGFDGILKKPFTKKELEEVIFKIMISKE